MAHKHVRDKKDISLIKHVEYMQDVKRVSRRLSCTVKAVQVHRVDPTHEVLVAILRPSPIDPLPSTQDVNTLAHKPPSAAMAQTVRKEQIIAEQPVQVPRALRPSPRSPPANHLLAACSPRKRTAHDSGGGLPGRDPLRAAR